MRIRLDGSAAPATVIDLDRDLVVPDGIRMLDPARLLVTELVGRLTLVNLQTGTTAVVSELDQPTSLIRVGGSLWVSEGQVLRLVSGEPPNLPFKGGAGGRLEPYSKPTGCSPRKPEQNGKGRSEEALERS